MAVWRIAALVRGAAATGAQTPPKGLLAPGLARSRVLIHRNGLVILLMPPIESTRPARPVPVSRWTSSQYDGCDVAFWPPGTEMLLRMILRMVPDVVGLPSGALSTVKKGASTRASCRSTLWLVL